MTIRDSRHNTIHTLLNVVLENAAVLWRTGIYFINSKKV